MSQRTSFLPKNAIPQFFCFISIFVLVIFVISRKSGFFPAASNPSAFTVIILASLSYLNYLMLRQEESSLYGLAIAVFTILKYYVASLLLLFWQGEFFNNYALKGNAVPVFLGFELVNFLVFLWNFSAINQSITKISISFLMVLLGCVAAIALLLLSLFSQPRIVELRYFEYEPSLAQHIQIWYMDYGGSSGITCEKFTVEQFGLFNSEKFDCSCRSRIYDRGCSTGVWFCGLSHGLLACYISCCIRGSSLKMKYLLCHLM